MVEALLERRTRITVITRNVAELKDVSRLVAATIAGDAADAELMNTVVAD
jgi:hypothetical protein